MALKNFLIGLLASLCAASLSASPMTTESVIGTFVSQTCVSVSTSAWVAVPTTIGASRTTVNYANIGATTVYLGGDNTKAITVAGAVVPTLGNFSMQIDGNLAVYAVALTSASTVCAWEVKQK